MRAPRGADRVAERHRAAVDVDPRRDRCRARASPPPPARRTLRSARTDRRRAIDQPAFFSTLRVASTGVISSIFGARPLVACATMRASGVRPSAVARSALITTSAAAPSLTRRRVAGGDRAVLLERRLQRAQRLGGRVGADRLVAIEDERVALLLRDRDRQDLGRERAGGVRRRGLLVALGGVRVLLVARHLVDARRRSRRRCPCASSRTGTTGRRGSSSRRPGRGPCAGPRARGAARYGALLIDSMPPATAISMSPVRMPCCASITALRPEPHTLLMVSAATWSARPPLSAACRAGAWPTPRRDDVAHDALVDERRIDAGARDGLANDQRAELRRGEVLQRAEELAGGRPDGADDDGFSHE